jgi:hypothetical protein
MEVTCAIVQGSIDRPESTQGASARVQSLSGQVTVHKRDPRTTCPHLCLDLRRHATEVRYASDGEPQDAHPLRASEQDRSRAGVWRCASRVGQPLHQAPTDSSCIAVEVLTPSRSLCTYNTCRGSTPHNYLYTPSEMAVGQYITMVNPLITHCAVEGLIHVWTRCLIDKFKLKMYNSQQSGRPS